VLLLAASVAARAQAPAAPATPPSLVDSGSPNGPNAPAASPATPSAAPAVAPRSARRRRAAPATPSPITDHLALEALYFWGKAATTGRFDNPTTDLEGTAFSAEHDLGLSDQAHEPLVELMFRLENRNRLRFDFIDLRRSGEATLSAPLQYGSQLFETGQTVQSELDWRETDFTYTYSFLRNDRVELGAGAGLHLIQAYASAQVPHTDLRDVYSAAGPFATVALDGTWRMTRRWSFNARGQYLRLAIDSSNGLLGDYHADVQFRWFPNFAVGAGYEYRHVLVDIRNANPSGEVQLNISGPEVFLRASL